MKRVPFAEFALFAGSLLFAGCTGAAQPPRAASFARILALPDGAAIVPQPDRGASSVATKAKAAPRLLYVSDLATFTVKIYDFPSLAKVGKLTGFDDPQGLCTGARGSVWVTSTSSSQIFEFAHGATKPQAELSDPVGFPVGCAFDRRTGNLAVTDIENFSGDGSVLVYKRAHGTPSVYGTPAQSADYFAAYDASGNLYVSGSSSQHYILTVLAHGASSLTPVKITGGTIFFPGTVTWHGSTLVLGDQRCKNRAGSCLYRTAVSGKTARITGSIPFDGACDIAQAWVGALQIAAGDDQANCKYGTSAVGLWPYPAGGKPSITATGLGMPVGATVSTVGAP